MEFPPRLNPERQLPSYSYVSGQFPHPLRDPAGHSFGQSHEPPPIDPAHWQASADYRFAIDLFNHGFYWEAHETWEGLWIAAGQRGPTADFLKGLIKLAAAGVKAREGRGAGVCRHALRASELFAGVQTAIAPAARYCGLSLSDLQQYAQALAEQPIVRPEPARVSIVFDFALRPE